MQVSGLEADSEFIFRDWGQPAAILEVVRQYDAETGMLHETRHMSAVRVVVAGLETRQQKEPVARPAFETMGFLIRAAELPPQVLMTSAQIEFRGRRWGVRTMHPASLAGVVLLECVAASLTEDN